MRTIKLFEKIKQYFRNSDSAQPEESLQQPQSENTSTGLETTLENAIFGSTESTDANKITVAQNPDNASVIADDNQETNTNYIAPIEKKELQIPSGYTRKRIFGIENEYGVTDIINMPNQSFIANGGRLYQDCGHIEYCTPETRSPLDAVKFDKAGELLVINHSTEKIYKNNIDSQGNTFGTHENYFVQCANYDYFEKLVPFLITRQIFTGSGRINDNGQYEISQKTYSLERVMNGDSTSNKGIISGRNESHSNSINWRRLHLTLGDANMCETADFLKIGATGLVLDLFEDGKLPIENNTYENAVKIAKQIAQGTSKDKWKMGDWWQTTRDNALDLQWKYYEAAKSQYHNRDEITNKVLDLWGFTLSSLDSDSTQLFGYVDWITKKMFIDDYAQRNKIDTRQGYLDHRLRNIDLQYHEVNLEHGLFYVLQNQGYITKIISEDAIKEAATNPPTDTRALVRGTFYKAFNDCNNFNWVAADWTRVEGQLIISQGIKPVGPFYINDPFDTYEQHMAQIIKMRDEAK